VDGFGNNMVNYLTLQLHMPLTKAANTVTNFKGTASLTPLLGAFVADSYAGPFWTVTVASITYQIVRYITSLSLSLSLKLDIHKIFSYLFSCLTLSL
jgi:peptide/histidine transporter 3/4